MKLNFQPSRLLLLASCLLPLLLASGALAQTPAATSAAPAPGGGQEALPDFSLLIPHSALPVGEVIPDSSFPIPHSSLPIDPGVLQPFVDGLLGKYGWLTTVLLAIGSRRILFKPVMLVVENTVKNDPAKAAA